jgi:hypothetical protein
MLSGGKNLFAIGAERRAIGSQTSGNSRRIWDFRVAKTQGVILAPGLFLLARVACGLVQRRYGAKSNRYQGKSRQQRSHGDTSVEALVKSPIFELLKRVCSRSGSVIIFRLSEGASGISLVNRFRQAFQRRFSYH